MFLNEVPSKNDMKLSSNSALSAFETGIFERQNIEKRFRESVDKESELDQIKPTSQHSRV